MLGVRYSTPEIVVPPEAVRGAKVKAIEIR